MKLSRYFLYYFFIAAIVLSSCSNDDSTSSESTGSATMSAKIDGSAWTATINGATNSNGLIAFAGQDGSVRQIQFRVMNVTQTGTYQIGGSIMNVNTAQLSEGTKVWTSGLGMGSGSVTFTKVSSTEAEGTFALTLAPVTSSRATGTKNVTDGKFAIKFK